MRLRATILLFALVTLAYPQTVGVSGLQIFSNESDRLFNEANEQSAPVDMGQRVDGNSVLRTFSVNAIASGGPTSCTWNVFCTNKRHNNSTLAAGDYNSIGEVSGSPSDLSCLGNNAQRFTRFVNILASTCYVELVSIGGGTTPAVTFHLTGTRE